MLFSIVVPVFNAETYLKECVESVLSQSLDDFELILINDGSTDRSFEIMEQFRKKSPKVQSLSQRNGGQFSARLLGMHHAKGDYLIFLDSDDCIHKNALEILKQYLLLHGWPDILFHRAGIRQDFTDSAIDYPFRDGTLFKNETKSELYKLFLASSSLNSLCFKAYRRDLLNKITWDTKLISSIRNGEDLMQNLPVFHQAESVVYCDKILYYYRKNEESVTHKYSPTYYFSYQVLLRELKHYLSLWNLGKEFEKVLDQRILRELIEVFVNLKHTDRKTRKAKLKEICNDEWFRSLYQRTDKKTFPRKTRFFFALAYAKKLFSVDIILKLV